MLKNYLLIFLISMVPIIELRGAIPIGLGMGLPVLPTYLLCVLGNMIPVPFIYLFARMTVALLLFVGIPLPGTGAWTGTLAASILDMKFKDVLIACMGGVLLAGIIMGLASAGLLGALSGLFAAG